jgi:hypothetical protein
MSSIVDDTCFLNISTTDRAALKALPETEVDHVDNSVSALVEDSDGEEEYHLPVPVAAPQVEESVAAVNEEPKKKAVARKVKSNKTDA